jgi:hypothetical protein
MPEILIMFISFICNKVCSFNLPLSFGYTRTKEKLKNFRWKSLEKKAMKAKEKRKNLEP